MTILILGGTREATALASKLVNEGKEVITSLAGRTREPLHIEGQLRIGGFGGVDGLTSYINENGITKVIDATHPFATQISANAVAAADHAGIKLEVHTRPPWRKQDGDFWVEVSSLAEARDAIPARARVLLALGSQHLAGFANRSDIHYLVRMVDPPESPPALPDHELLIARPSVDWKDEADLLRAHKITHIVCRNSGGTGAYAKIEAARKLQLPVIMVDRPG